MYKEGNKKMKELFMSLLLNVVNIGELIEANMYRNGDFANIKITTDSGTYSISISKEEKNAD